MGLTLRKQHRLREKDVRRLAAAWERAFGVPAFGDLDVDRAETGHVDVIIAESQVLALIAPATEAGGDEVVIPTVRGLLRWRPVKGHVTVDMGAVRFINNGADVMAPGIVEADPGIVAAAPVWIRDERNKQPLAAGTALVDGPAMVRGRGKAAKTYTFVGDEFWDLAAIREKK